ncbi:class I SAM-dependent methyltransferase [Achromobacter aloeverae]|uniref:SAM-dependent methyltransferase n=1 Tax=Achromobacter aloeverae TaxID=1750518 RepID=A0A4Q1HMY4_9BURK|nr:SAM-dependent methyltransferase [Achromobacter aloeverae]RXN91165.1 SAM-dependent methyltransferase [Achromobacter aloeverae]
MTKNHDIRPGQSVELLKELHILTRDGKLNQDSRRKLKQVYHLFQFIEPLLQALKQEGRDITLVDHGAGKSYLGFILYDLFFKTLHDASHIYGIETREELVRRSQELADRLGFGAGMSFLNLSVADSIVSDKLPPQVDVVTALHACDTATDDALRFALNRHARYIVVVPCCQAEVASVLRKNKGETKRDPLSEIWRHPLHTREFGSQVTNVLRCLQLEAHGYQVSVTELVGWEHSMKNELIIAQHKNPPQRRAAERLNEMLDRIGLRELRERFFAPDASAGATQ